jgi:ribosome-binding protein aMBF1 (putative translation factor)
MTKCELCGTEMDLHKTTAHVVKCKTCNQFGYICSACKRKHPKLHNHPSPLRLVPRQSLLESEEHHDA